MFFVREMKKSTIGIAVLVSMVLAKACFFDLTSDDESAVSRSVDTQSNLALSSEIRSEHHQPSHFSPSLNLLASNYQGADVSEMKIVKPVVVDEPNQPSQDDLVSNVIQSSIVSDENNTTPSSDVIPSDYVSNTGYGLWKQSSQKIISRSEREGKVPLDRGNTITDNMSKLFPRQP